MIVYHLYLIFNFLVSRSFIDIPLNLLLLSFIYDEEYLVKGTTIFSWECLFWERVMDLLRKFYELEPRFTEPITLFLMSER